MYPSRMKCSCEAFQSGAVSKPTLTLSHSTTTVPLNFLGSDGARTNSRVLYDAVLLGVTFHRPSLLSACRDVYAAAVPDRRYSFSEYPMSPSGRAEASNAKPCVPP